ncbi:lipopolysaccharide heptosyltransferase family protein [bacterium]|nr:lipopolysaccharide heptosyltransferase family protein [bacterium]
MKSILLLRPDKAGDLIKSLPAIRALNSMGSNFEVHVMTSQANHSILKFEPAIRYSVLPNNWAEKTDEKLKSIIKEITHNAYFDSAINLLCDPFADVERLLNLSPAQDKFSVISESLPVGVWPLSLQKGTPENRDETLNIGELLERALEVEILNSIAFKDTSPKLGVEDFSEAEINLGFKEGFWLGICPFAGTANRTHSTKKWIKFIAKILTYSKYKKCIVFGAPSDSETLHEIAQKLNCPERLHISIPSSFRALGAYLKRCDQVVAVDSGPLHFSLSLGIPSLGFLSGGDHLRWFNRVSPQDKIIRRGIFNRYPSYIEMLWHFSRWA